MAKIRYGFQGDNTLRGAPFTELSLQDCIEKLGLQPSHWINPFGESFKIGGGVRPDLEAIADLAVIGPPLLGDPVSIVVEVFDADVVGHKEWKTGYYLPPVSPSNAHKRLGLT